MNDPSAQLCLRLRVAEGSGFDSFIAAGNDETKTAVHRWATGAQAGDLYLHGEANVGKSHLLQAAYQTATAGDASARFVALDMPGLRPSVLDELEGTENIVLDALDAVVGAPDWELALFNLYNRAHQGGGRLLVAARAPAPRLGFGLPDLSSRLSACAVYALRPLDDEGRALLLVHRAKQRGIRMDQAAIDYTLARCPRDTASLLRLVDELDRESLNRRRAPTPRFIGEVLRRYMDECGKPPEG
jgi:DnaA family protein